MAVGIQVAQTFLRLIRGHVVRISEGVDLCTDVERGAKEIVDTYCEGTAEVPRFGNGLTHRFGFVVFHLVLRVSHAYAGTCIPHQVGHILEGEVTIHACVHVVRERLSVTYGPVVRNISFVHVTTCTRYTCITGVVCKVQTAPQVQFPQVLEELARFESHHELFVAPVGGEGCSFVARQVARQGIDASVAVVSYSGCNGEFTFFSGCNPCCCFVRALQDRAWA